MMHRGVASHDDIDHAGTQDRRIDRTLTCRTLPPPARRATRRTSPRASPRRYVARATSPDALACCRGARRRQRAADRAGRRRFPAARGPRRHRAQPQGCSRCSSAPTPRRRRCVRSPGARSSAAPGQAPRRGAGVGRLVAILHAALFANHSARGDGPAAGGVHRPVRRGGLPRRRDRDGDLRPRARPRHRRPRPPHRAREARPLHRDGEPAFRPAAR